DDVRPPVLPIRDPIFVLAIDYPVKSGEFLRYPLREEKSRVLNHSLDEGERRGTLDIELWRHSLKATTGIEGRLSYGPIVARGPGARQAVGLFGLVGRDVRGRMHTRIDSDNLK